MRSRAGLELQQSKFEPLAVRHLIESRSNPDTQAR